MPQSLEFGMGLRREDDREWRLRRRAAVDRPADNSAHLEETYGVCREHELRATSAARPGPYLQNGASTGSITDRSTGLSTSSPAPTSSARTVSGGRTQDVRGCAGEGSLAFVRHITSGGGLYALQRDCCRRAQSGEGGGGPGIGLDPEAPSVLIIAISCSSAGFGRVRGRCPLRSRPRRVSRGASGDTCTLPHVAGVLLDVAR